MRICIIGKYPPIQGGVSMRNYWSAHALAAAGHDVHVVTNAKEAQPPFRMYMRPDDWKQCNAAFDRGAVTVHWTDPVDRSQSYIPMASPFVSKLAGIAAQLNAEQRFDLIFSFYLEPYAVAGHLLSQMTSVPHVVRMAGSDAGRLWHHPQLESLYDHVLRSAEIVIAAGSVAERAVERGIVADRVAFGGSFVVPDHLFSSDGPRLDFAQLRTQIEAEPGLRDQWWGELDPRRPHFGVYGKLGENKGSFALLAAIERLKRKGLDVGLVALAHGQLAVEKRFRSRATKLGVADRILQIPFLPHWRVPEFLRGCLAVCCLEQDFPVQFHSPIIPREVLLCGTCLVASTEVLRKLPAYARLPHGYGCVAISDVNDVDALSERLEAIVRAPTRAAAIGARGRAFAREMQQDISFAGTLEDICAAAVTGRRSALTTQASASQRMIEAARGRFALTQLVAAEIGESCGDPALDRTRACEVLTVLEQRMKNGDASLRSMVAAVTLEIVIAAAEEDEQIPSVDHDPLFRLRTHAWGLDDAELVRLVPVRESNLRILEFDYDVSQFMGVRAVADLPVTPTPGRSYIVVFCGSRWGQREPLLIDQVTAQILKLSDGTRTVSQLLADLPLPKSEETNNIRWIEGLFVGGLISLQDDLNAPQDASDFRRRGNAKKGRLPSHRDRQAAL